MQKIERSHVHDIVFQKPLQWLILFIILVTSLLFLNVVNARTPPVHGESKPDGLLIQLPFEPGTSSHLRYNSYGDGKHTIGDGRDYYAIDFSLNGGDVYPIASGRVIRRKEDNCTKDCYGNYVLIEHTPNFPGYVSLYAHLANISSDFPAEGQNVSVDTIIGREGSAGTPTQHLHFALWHCDNVVPGNYPSGCKAVVPEPFLGVNVYEGLDWWHTLNKNTRVTAASRPIWDANPPLPENNYWNSGATNNNAEIDLNTPVKFDIHYEDVETGIGEIRLTMYYQNWATPDNLDDFNSASVWRILARCNPDQARPLSGCNDNHWQFTWNPYTDDGTVNTFAGLLPVPWLPKANRPPTGNMPVDACISFDVFDKAGNPIYSPGGTQCNFSSQSPNVLNVASPLDNQARFIRIMPMRDGLPNPNQAVFVADITLPDGAVVTPGASLVKTWRVRNSGTSTWDGYSLGFQSGDQMGGSSPVAIPRTAPGQEVDISVNLTAPDHSATGRWHIVDPAGTHVPGGALWVSLVVEDNNNPPPPPSDFTLRCLNCPSTVEPGQTFRPVIRAAIGSGQMLESRGDMLRHKSGNLFGAWPHIPVSGVVNQGESYDFTFYADNPITAPTTNGTYQSAWQLWQNGQWVGPEYTITFTVQSGGGSNRPPNAPSLTGPGDWAVYQGSSGIALTAQENGDSDGDAVTQYYFEIFDSAQNANSGWITGNSWSPQGLGFNGYQWHVKVRDSKGAESGWSETWRFTVYDPNIDITQLDFVPLDPDGEIVRILACADAPATLRVDVNTANDGSDNGEWRTLKELGVPCFNDNDAPTWNTLEYETGPHLVRVLARGDGGWANAASREAVYTVPANHRPNQPFGQLPQNNSYVNATTVTFKWIETLRTTGYRLQAATDAGFSTLLLDRTFSYGTTSYTHTFSSAHGTVYWRVIATGPYGTNESVQSFHIDMTPPVSSITSLPAVTTDTQFSVNWAGSDVRSGVRWYDVQMRDGNRPDDEWEDWLVNTTKTAELFQGQAGHTYYFRVRAMDEIGNWEAWPANDGDTYTLVDPSAAPPAAWWNNNYAQKRNLIVLNNDSDTIPVHYPIRVHFDSTTTPTAAEIYNASLSLVKGDDVRVIYNNQVELNRFVQRFTSSQIDIWFPLQVALGSSQSDSSSYQVYYGYAGASAPPSNVNSVFLPEADSNTVLLAHFQENSGSVVADSSGRSHNGSFAGAGWIDGYLGFAGLFNGSTSFVDFGNSTDFNVGAMTLEAWILVTANTGSYERFFDKETYHFNVSGSRQPQYRAFGAEASGVCPNLELNKWYHLAATYNGSNRARIYINGVMCTIPSPHI